MNNKSKTFPHFKKLSILLATLGLQAFTPVVLADSPRLFLWGLAGSEAIARADALLPLVDTRPNKLFYTDIIAQTDSDKAWYASAGLGYRGIRGNRIYGGYLFYDRSTLNSHDYFNVISPGIETLGNVFDARLNGYLMVGSQHKLRIFDPTEQSNETFHDSCGVNFDTEQSVFIGHQHFLPQLISHQKVGAGVDAEVGYHFPQLTNLSLYGGGYFYDIHQFQNIKGVEARTIYNFKPALALTLEASYDNYQHGAIVGGLRVQLGHTADGPITLEQRLYDQIPRNLGNVKSGSSIPIIREETAGELRLVRDNIYFFTGTGGTTFTGAGSGTYENPLAANQFTQMTVNGIAAITPNANLFFNPGNYVMNPVTPAAPNSSISLPQGQNIFGRTPDYRQSAIGGQRPVLLGELILASDNHTIDSIVLTNSITNPSPTFDTLTALQVIDAAEIHICNSQINAIMNFTGANEFSRQINGIDTSGSEIRIDNSVVNATTNVAGVNDATLAVTGILPHTSPNEVDIEGSAINATATVTAGTTNGETLVTGIGGTATPGIDFAIVGNIFRIENSQVTANYNAGAAPNFISAVAGIGGNARNAGQVFDNNTFLISNSQVVASNQVGGTTFADNYAVGIGSNQIGVGNSSFSSNIFLLESTAVQGIVTTAINNDSILATGIGANVDFGTVAFANNVMDLTSSQISATAATNQTAGPSVLMTSGIGANTELGGTANFAGNLFDIADSTVIAQSNIEQSNIGANLAVGIGINTFLGSGSSDFDSNVFSMTNSVITSIATTNGNNITTTGVNFATIIGGNVANNGSADFTNNLLELINTQLTATAEVFNNDHLNFAAGIGGNTVGDALNNTGNIYLITNTQSNATANIIDSNSANNLAANVGINAADGGVSLFDSNLLDIISSTLTATANINTNNLAGTSAANNGAIGIGSNTHNASAAVSNNILIIEEASIVQATANIVATNEAVGLVLSNNFAAGMGSNVFGGLGTVGDFTDNIVSITNSQLSGNSSVDVNQGNNFTTGIGANISELLNTTAISNNTLSIDTNSVMDSNATVSSNALSARNASSGTGGNYVGVPLMTFTNNIVDIVDTTINVLARVVNANNGSDRAIGLIADAGTSIDITDSTVNVTADATGGVAVGTQGAGTINPVNTTFNVTP